MTFIKSLDEEFSKKQFDFLCNSVRSGTERKFMKILSRVFVGMFMVATLACSGLKSAANADGVYQFDTSAYKTALDKMDDPVFKNLTEDMMNQMMSDLSKFTIEIKGSEATATFDDMVVKGALEKMASEGSAMKFMLTPYDEDKKEDKATLIIEGTNLTLDPGRNETDKLYFVKK